jgi:hypothetical protein
LKLRQYAHRPAPTIVVVSRGPSRRAKNGNSVVADAPVSASWKCQNKGVTAVVEPRGSSRR